MILLVALALTLTGSVFANEDDCKLTSRELLQKTGMDEATLSEMDDELMDYISENLCSQVEDIDDVTWIPTSVELSDTRMEGSRNTQLLTNISFSAYAYKSGSVIYIYPTYEFTDMKRPRGNDSFAFQLGNAMAPYSFGGKMWYKLNAGDSWQSNPNDILTPNFTPLDGAVYSGNQLGTPDFPLYLRGVTYCYCSAGAGSDKRIAITYMYNPSILGFSYSFSYMGFGVNYTSSGTIYQASTIITLSY